jgi:hypothetical protein
MILMSGCEGRLFEVVVVVDLNLLLIGYLNQGLGLEVGGLPVVQVEDFQLLGT